MVTRQMRANSHDNGSSIHLVSEKKTKNGEEVCVCTDLIKDFEIMRDIVTVLDIQNRSIIGADIVIKTDYIDNATYLILETTMSTIDSISVQIDEERYIDSLIESVDNDVVLSNTVYIGNLKKSLVSDFETMLLENHGRLLTSAETVVSHIEVYDDTNELVLKANRFKLDINTNSLDMNLYECLGSGSELDFIDSGSSYRIEFYIGSKKIVAENCDSEEFVSRNKIGYGIFTCYRSNLSICDGDVDLYSHAKTALGTLKLNNGDDIETCLEYLMEYNSGQNVLKYIRKNKLKGSIKTIDIDKYLLEDLI